MVKNAKPRPISNASTCSCPLYYPSSNGSISVQDVVVSSSHRGKQLGKLVVSLASVLAARLGCYKVTHN